MRATRGRTFSAILGSVVLASHDAGATERVWPNDGAEATVAAALKNAPAGKPLVVVLPKGAWVYTGTVSSGRSDLVVIGAGPKSTRIYRTDETTAALLKFAKSSNVRVAELAVDGNAAKASAAEGFGVWFSDVTDFRVDHGEFSHHGDAGVRSNGTSRGVVDHASFVDNYKAPIANLGYGVVVYGDGTIHNEPFGTAEATFIEDSTFTGSRHAVASNNGARYVFRHNDVANNVVAHAIDAHGQEYGGVVGTEWVDVNNNHVHDPVYSNAGVRLRGGKGLVWNNTIDGYTWGVWLTEYTPQKTGPVNVWGNTVTNGLVTTDGSSTYATKALAGYKPYAYPHPLVSALRAAAGPDMIVTAGAGGVGEVYLDGSTSKAGVGSVKAHRWDAAVAHLSDCARDVVSLPVGTHVVLLEAERDDGVLAHDTALVEVVKPGPLASGPTWPSRWFVPIVGKAHVTLTVTPSSAKMDGYVALTGRHGVATHDDDAVIVRASTAGVFDARDGGAYAAVNGVPYVAGKTYTVTLDVDVAAQTYDAAVDGVVVAKGYAFRKAETALGRLVAWHDKGSLQVGDFDAAGDLATPDPACAVVPGGGGAGGAGGAGGGSAGGSGGTGGSGAGGASTSAQGGAGGLDAAGGASAGGLAGSGRAEASTGGGTHAGGPSEPAANDGSTGGCACAFAGAAGAPSRSRGTWLALTLASGAVIARRSRRSHPRR